MRKVLLATTIFLFTNLYAPPPEFDKDLVKQVDHYYKDKGFYESEFNTQKFFEAMVFIGIQNPKIVMKQSLLETGRFTSRVFREMRNPFGMHFPTKRETTATGWQYADPDNGNYAKVSSYDYWYDAVKDYKIWQDYWVKQKLSPECYYQFLHDLPYATSKIYVKVLKSIDLEEIIT